MAAGTETLKRTPLHDRHAAAGARLVPFAGLGDAGAVRRDPRGARRGADRRSACSTSATWARSRRRGPDAEAFLQRILSNDVSKIAADGAQYSVLCKADGGVLDDLFTYRLGPDRFLTVTNASQPREGPRVVPAARAASSTSTVEDRLHDYAMLAVQGPDARDARRAARRRRAAEAVPDRHAHRRRSAENVLVAGTGYTGEDGVELLLAPAARDARSGTRSPSTAPRPSASAPATPSASRSASTSTATTCPRTAARSRPASAGAARRTRASSAPTRSAAARENGTAEQLVPFVAHRPRHRPPGQPDRRAAAW